MYKQVRFRLSMLWAALTHDPFSVRSWVLAVRVPRVAGGSGEDDSGEDEGGKSGAEGKGQEPAAGEGGEKPPWGSDDEFDPKRAWKLIEELRGDSGKVKADNEKLRKAEKERADASKSDQQKLVEQAADNEKAAASASQEAARLRVALKKGLTETQAKRLIGDTEEDLEKDADELLESFKTEGQAPSNRRPQERLRPGAAPSSEPEETDPDKLAAQVPRQY